MSLITINKQADPNVSNEIDASKLHQFFRSGYTFKKNSQVSLVNLSVKNDLRNFDVIKGVNDTFVWRIGVHPTYMQKEVILSPQSYNGDALATEIQTKLNASVILGLYKDQFTCSYDGNLNKFTIEYNQNGTGDNTNTFQVYKIEDEDRNLVIDTTNPDNVSFTFGDNQYDNDSLEKQGKEYIITGDKGIFGNGGNSSLISRPVQGYEKTSTLTALKAHPLSDSTASVINNVQFEDATTTALTNGWDLQDATKSYFIQISDEGTLRIGYNEDYPPSDEDDTFFYTPTANYFEAFEDNDRTTTAIDFLIYHSGPSSGTLPLTLENLGYSSCSIGFVRDYLYKGRKNYDVGDYEIRESYGGHDVIFSMDDNGTTVAFDLSRMLQVPGKKFPQTGWRRQNITAKNITPSNFNTLPDAPAVWGSFTYKTDHIKMSIEIDSNQKIIVKVSHDTAGNDTFIEEIIFRQSGNADGFNSLIKEIQYPLRPVLCLGTGGRYKGAVYNCTGLYDLTEIHNPHHLFKNDNHLENEILTHPVNEMAISLGAPLTLSFFVKFDKLDDSDVIPANSFDPNTANISQLIGMDRFVNIANGSPTNEAISSGTPNNIITLPTMYLSLPQFNNIRSINYSGDNSKDIAVIQGSDFKVDEQSGIYNYSPNTLLYTSLGLSNDTILYDIQAELRYASGNLVKNLQLPTTITLHVKQ